MRHLIVCGYSRSGTTMFHNMLCRSLHGYTVFDKEVGASKVLSRSDPNVLSKNPLDLFRLKHIARSNILGKQLLLFIVIRDIRSILTSYNVAVPDDYFIAYDHSYLPDHMGKAPYTGPGIISTAEAINRALDNEDFQSMIVRYEDLVTNPAAEEARIREAAGLTFHRPFEDFHKRKMPEGLTRQLNGQRPLDKSRLDAWKADEHSQRIRSQFTRCPALFDLLIEYGYEENRDWFEPYRRKHPPGQKSATGGRAG